MAKDKTPAELAVQHVIAVMGCGKAEAGVIVGNLGEDVLNHADYLSLGNALAAAGGLVVKKEDVETFKEFKPSTDGPSVEASAMPPEEPPKRKKKP